MHIGPKYFEHILNEAVEVKLEARSFLLPIPKGSAKGEVMVYSDDVYIRQEDKYGGNKSIILHKKGDPLLDSKGKPKGTGFVFGNDTDGVCQGARDDGEEMIIFNALNPEARADEEEWLYDLYTKNIARDPGQATHSNIWEFLDIACRMAGFYDRYNAKRAKIKDFEPVKRHPDCPDCGIFIRRTPPNEIRRALLVETSGKLTFDGPAPTPQHANGRNGDKTNVVLVTNEIPDPKNSEHTISHSWFVQTDKFLLTYKNPDGSKIDITKFPTVRAEEGIPPQLVQKTLLQRLGFSPRQNMT